MYLQQQLFYHVAQQTLLRKTYRIIITTLFLQDSTTLNNYIMSLALNVTSRKGHPKIFRNKPVDNLYCRVLHARSLQKGHERKLTLFSLSKKKKKLTLVLCAEIGPDTQGRNTGLDYIYGRYVHQPTNLLFLRFEVFLVYPLPLVGVLSAPGRIGVLKLRFESDL